MHLENVVSSTVRHGTLRHTAIKKFMLAETFCDSAKS